MNKGKGVMNKKIDNTKAFFIIMFVVISIFTIFIVTVRASEYTDDMPTYADVADNTLILEDKDYFDILNIIDENNKINKKEEISQVEEDLEYTTIYRYNNELPKGMLQVIQEGRDGKEQIITKKYFENEELVNETITYNILVASIDKIVEIGNANYTSNYKIKIGDILYVTSDTLAVRILPDKNSEKIITISKNDSIKLLDIQDNWYKIKYNTYKGYIPKDCVTYIDPTKDSVQYAGDEKSKSELLSGLSKDMSLNKPSGLTLEQFKKVLSNNSQDKNRIFENNAEYFYYAEKQYNINGIFVAAIGIHESAWGTSKISQDKRNLFGYGANDSNPYGNAKIFGTYAEGIDLVSRVLVKYYLNSSGTSIYDGETANGKYYNGATLTGVNKKYASDKNWNNGVYKWMSYLYNRL